MGPVGNSGTPVTVINRRVNNTVNATGATAVMKSEQAEGCKTTFCARGIFLIRACLHSWLMSIFMIHQFGLTFELEMDVLAGGVGWG